MAFLSAPHPCPHPSVPDRLAAMQAAIADLQAGRREDHVKIEVLHAKIETQQEFIEDLQAQRREDHIKMEDQGRMLEKLMKSHRRSQELTSLHMLEQYRKKLLQAARRESTGTIPVLIQRIRRDPNTTEFDRWVLNEYARVSEFIHGEHSKHEAREVAETRGGMYSELYRRLYASD